VSVPDLFVSAAVLGVLELCPVGLDPARCARAADPFLSAAVLGLLELCPVGLDPALCVDAADHFLSAPAPSESVQGLFISIPDLSLEDGCLVLSAEIHFQSAGVEGGTARGVFGQKKATCGLRMDRVESEKVHSLFAKRRSLKDVTGFLSAETHGESASDGALASLPG